jgi:hypothetical protein
LGGADAAWAGVAVTALTLAWAVTLALLRAVLRRVREDTTQQLEIGALRGDLTRAMADQARYQAAVQDQMNADRAATDRRLRWLEEHLWKTSPRAR